MSKQDIVPKHLHQSKLRFLPVNHGHLEENFEHLHKSLRWHGCPFGYMPAIFHLQELLAHNSSQSCHSSWFGIFCTKLFEKLRVQDIGASYFLKTSKHVEIDYEGF